MSLAPVVKAPIKGFAQQSAATRVRALQAIQNVTFIWRTFMFISLSVLPASLFNTSPFSPPNSPPLTPYFPHPFSLSIFHVSPIPLSVVHEDIIYVCCTQSCMFCMQADASTQPIQVSINCFLAPLLIYIILLQLKYIHKVFCNCLTYVLKLGLPSE